MKQDSLLSRIFNTGILIGCLVLPAQYLQAQIPEGNKTLITDFSFKTEDGWTLYATLYLPPDERQNPIPGVVILSEPDWVPRSISDEISLGIAERGMAALAIDVRGTDNSYGDKAYQLFTQAERDAMQLDIRAAVDFLSSRPEVDGNRIAVFGASVMVDYVVREAAANIDQIKAIMLSTGWLTDKGREAIKDRKDLPVLAFMSEDDSKEKQQLASEPYFLSSDNGSQLLTVMDRGASIFNRPGDPIGKTTDWLMKNLMGVGYPSEISFRTEDKKLFHRTLYMPDWQDT